MKNIISFLLILALLCCFSVYGFGEELIESVGAGQLCTIDARNGLTYRTEFLPTTVDRVSVSGDDLMIEISGGCITLSGFFADGREARQLLFADGSFITGEDFDDAGAFTGELYSSIDTLKENSELRSMYAENPDAFLNCLVRQVPYGYEVIRDGYAVWGDEKQLMLAKYQSIFGEGGLDMSTNSSNELLMRLNADGSYTAVRQTLFTKDGFIIVCPQPESLAVMNRSLFVPLGESRVTVTYYNQFGTPLYQFNAKINDDNGALSLSLVCPQCGEDTGGEVHLSPCGHFTCQSGFDASAHYLAGCGIAGHCANDGAEHGICKNCQGYLCDGNAHGYGVCQHVHQWFTTSYTPGDEFNPPQSTCICLICGQTIKF